MKIEKKIQTITEIIKQDLKRIYCDNCEGGDNCEARQILIKIK